MDESKYREGDIIEEGPYQGFEIISQYTRAQAIQDGVLIDVTNYARSLGITLPCAITAALWGIVEADTMAEEAGETTATRLADMLNMMKVGVRGMNGDDDMLLFEVMFTRCGRPLATKVKGICGPGDSGEPVITLMLPEED